jgi:hypothetical protein
MIIFDPHIHMTSRTTDDYAAMRAAGVRALVEPAFWLGQPRTSVASFTDYFDGLIGWEPFRASQFGIRHHCAIALNPKEANDPRCAQVLDLVPRYLAKDGVVAVGEIGYDSMTPAEDSAFARQLELAVSAHLPALVHTPHRDKLAGTLRSLAVIRESGIDPGLVVLDHPMVMPCSPVQRSRVRASGTTSLRLDESRHGRGKPGNRRSLEYEPDWKIQVEFVLNIRHHLQREPGIPAGGEEVLVSAQIMAERLGPDGVDPALDLALRRARARHGVGWRHRGGRPPRSPASGRTGRPAGQS